MSDNYRLKVSEDGRINYIARAGKDLYKGKATEEQAGWMMKNKEITRGTPTDWPDYCVCAGGDFWFEGSWEDTSSALRAPSPKGEGYAKEPSIFDDAADKQERPRTKNRKRGD